MFCVKCGGELKENQMFCPICGQVIQMVPDYNPLDDELSKHIFENTESEPEVDSQMDTLPGNQPREKTKSLSSHFQLVIVILLVLIVGSFLISIIFISVNKQRSNSYEYQIEKAYENEISENFDAAVDYAQRALVLKPSDYDAQILLAEIYYETGNMDNSKMILHEITAVHRDNPEPYGLLVSILQSEENYKELAEIGKTLRNPEIRELFEPYIVEEPEFSIKEGSYGHQIQLVLTTNEKNLVYYTVDNTHPTEDSILYEDSILLVEGKTTVRAVARNSLGLYSNEVKKTYTIKYPVPGVPNINPKSGIYKEPTQIDIFVPEGCEAYYTFDGSVPTKESAKYLGPLEMPEGNGIFSVVIYNEYDRSSPIEQRNYEYRPEME